MYKKLKLCFMGSPKFSVPSLKNLIDAGHDISVVITQEPKRANRGKRFIKQPVQEFSEKMGLKVLYGNQLKENMSAYKINLQEDILEKIDYLHLKRMNPAP